jgi:hypothetical protein
MIAHTLCAGWPTCPTNAVATWGANEPWCLARRGGRPWLCKACDARRLGIVDPAAPTKQCAGWRGNCDAVPHATVDTATAVARRKGEPWRCRACSAKRCGELRRGEAHWEASKTHCPKGHEYTTENTLVYAPPGRRPHRYCRACRRARGAAAPNPSPPVAERRCA